MNTCGTAEAQTMRQRGINSIDDRINNVNMRLDEVLIRLENARDRIYGNVPRPVEGADKITNEPSGYIDSMERKINATHNKLDIVSEILAEIEDFV